MFESILLVAFIVGFAALGGLMIWLSRQNRPSTPAFDPQALLLIQQRIETLNQEVKGSLSENVRHQQTVSFQMTSAVRDVTERLAKIEETNRQVLGFSSQLENLQRVLTNPKQRGILGEYYLETLLKNVLSPDQYQMQYKFQDGTIVDAVVFVKEKIIPIDSKFSLENYNRFVEEKDPLEHERLEKVFKADLKSRIDETAKYVKPNEGTMDFAFMFIPHEAIYYDLLVSTVGAVKINTRDLIEYAFKEKHVIIVSPTSFLAYLQTVLQGLRALQIEESAKAIRKNVEDLRKHLAAYEQYFQSLGKNLGTVVNQYNLAGKEFTKIDKDVLRITGEGTGFQALPVDRPLDEFER